MKKLLTLVLSVLMVISLAACSSTPKENAEETSVKNTEENTISGKVVYSAWGSAEEKAMEEALVAEFNKVYPDVEVEYIHVDGNYEQKLQTMIAGSSAPDVMAIGGAHVATFKDAFAEIDINDIDTSKYISDTLVKGLTFDGTQYALPKRVNTKVMAYNIDLLEQVGLETVVGDLSLDEFVEKAKAVRELGEKDGMQIYGSDPLWAGQVIFQNGGRIFSEDGKQSLFTSEEAIDGVQFCIDAFKKYGYAPSPAESSGVNMMDMFLAGYVGFKGDFGPYFLPLVSEVTDLNWDITSPAGQGGEMEIVGLAVSKDAQSPEAAEAFVKFLSTSKEAQTVVANGANLPVTEEAKEVFINRMPDKNLQAFFDAMDYETSQPMITQPEVYGTFYSALFDRTELGTAGTEDVKAVLEQVKVEIDEVLNK